MNELNDDTFVTDTLRRGTEELLTPYDAIATRSISAGRRLRRRRTVGVVLGSAACVAALSAGLVGLNQLRPASHTVDPGFGAGSSMSASVTPTPTPTLSATPTPGGQTDVPVRLELAGWTCEEFPIDQKSWCEGPHGVNASINWRPASDFDAWHGGDSDKTDDWVGDLHGDWFATVGVTSQDPQLARQLGEALVWQ